MEAVLAGGVFFAAVSDSALALVVGCSFALRWCKEGLPSQSTALRRFCLATVAAFIVSHAIRPWFVAASMSGSSSFIGNLKLFPVILTSTHQGTLWFTGSAGLVLLLGSLASNRLEPQLRELFVFISVLILAAAKAASGHAANEGDFTLAESSMLLHILGTAAWAGPVIVSGFMVMPSISRNASADALWRYGASLSQTVTWALLVLLASGIYTSYWELSGSMAGLWTTTWGQILLTKLACVLFALALGALTRFQCLRRPPTERRRVLMIRLVRIEAVAMVVILGMSAILSNTPPGEPESSGTVHHH